MDGDNGAMEPQPAPSLQHHSPMPLSKRENEIVRLLATGQRVGQIASLLGLSVKTVSTYRERALHKLRAASTADLTKYWHEQHPNDLFESPETVESLAQFAPPPMPSPYESYSPAMPTESLDPSPLPTGTQEPSVSDDTEPDQSTD